jgi:hypothetical protein
LSEEVRGLWIYENGNSVAAGGIREAAARISVHVIGISGQKHGIWKCADGVQK